MYIRNPEWDSLIAAENWEVVKGEGGYEIKAFGQTFKYNHPLSINFKLYRETSNPELKYTFLKKCHDYCWPQDIRSWHYWTEERFREHCAGWNYMSWAAGASTTKSYDAAKLLFLFWAANPEKRGVVVASTTLESMEARVWGYLTKLLKELKVSLPFKYYGGKPPKILYPLQKQDENNNRLKDTIHGIFAVSAKQGSDDDAISSWIGRHPDEALMVILDECTDLNVGITKAFINLDANEKPFQLIGIGNSNSWFDLHGILSTPQDPEQVLDPMKDRKWLTTRKNGVCLYFNPYDSPAIHEKDPVKKKILSSFLPTEASLREKLKEYGDKSESWWRFGLGFWKSKRGDNTIVSEELLKSTNSFNSPEWLGLEPLSYVGGLDVAFSTGGDECILQLAQLGQATDGRIVLDFKGESLQFKLPITAQSGEYAEIQIAKQVVKYLQQYGIPPGNIALDATGQGRAMGGTILLEYEKQGGMATRGPIKIYNVRQGTQAVNSFDVTIMTPLDLWNKAKEFIEAGSVRGVGRIAAEQFKTRQIIRNDKTKKVELETKKDYKKRMDGVNPALAHSPDQADAHTLAIQAAVMNFGFYPGQVKPIKGPTDIDKYAAWKSGVLARQQEHTSPLQHQRPNIPRASFKGTVIDAAKTRRGLP